MKRWVCLHGFTGNPQSWDPVLQQLPSGVEAICPSIVGHDPNVPLTGASFEEEVDRLAEGLPMSDGPYHLAGYSLGGRLALGLLVRHRQRFASAVLIGAHPGLGSSKERHERAVADDALAQKLEKDGVEAFVDYWQSLPLFQTQSTLPTTVLDAQRRQRLQHRAEGLASALRILSLGRMPDFRLALGNLDLPTCWMAGERDEKFCRLAKAIASKMPAATVRIVPEVGHNLLLEAPEEVAKVVKADLRLGAVSRE